MPFSVLIWGPGDLRWREKRENLASQLRMDGFDAHTSEAVSTQLQAMERAPSAPLTPPIEEQLHWQESNLIIALAFSMGPWTEVTQFSLFREFRQKVIVFYPWEWHSVSYFRQTYWGSALRQFLRTQPITAQGRR